MSVKKIILFLMMLSAVTFLCSCSAPEDTNHPLLVKARNCADKKDYKDAAKYYEMYISKYPKSQKAHIEAAAIYDENLKDPLMAIYHYRECLKNEISEQDEENIVKWMKASEQKYYYVLKRRVEGGEPDPAAYRAARAKKVVQELKSEESESPQHAIKEKSEDKTETAKQKPPQKIRYYTVKENDSLQKISSTVYGNSKYYKYILSSNQDILPSEKKLAIGQKLRILPLPESERK